MNLQRELSCRLQQAIAKAFPDAGDVDPLVAPAQNPQFGDYQANCAMSLSKRLKSNPRAIAQGIVEALDAGDLLEDPQIAGPGFINMRVRREFLQQRVAEASADERLGLAKADSPRKIVVDFGGPNTCKPMHIGHIRSIVIGDAIQRLLRLLGHEVTSDNHLGDWGTQFGLLIAGYKRWRDEPLSLTTPPGKPSHFLRTLVEFYKRANALAERDNDFRDEARQELAKLQCGDVGSLKLWQEYRNASQDHFNAIYRRMDVHFDETLGESFYNDMLPGVVRELTETEPPLAQKSEDALCVFWDDDSLPPLLVRKKDGAFLYATTDLATLKYRRDRWHPDEIVYVTDGRQQLHFRQIFSVAERWGVAGGIKLRHVWFGTILGPDGRPLKTRSGDLVELADVLDEAERRAMTIVREKTPDLDDAEAAEIARTVGLGAIKYADLSQNRQSDFVFDWDKMLSMQGNTAPYLQYAYARIRSIFRKGEESGDRPANAAVLLAEPAERTLGLKLLQWPEVVEAASDDYRMNLISNYLYELSSVFTGFYESCPVLKSELAQRDSRLQLCDLASRVLKTGLDVLGIKVLERM
ncbi:MAG: arginine--tRNA ligase [Planctomycetes bacterium]|nr:arginine--tRNA ligase [Planctomycetota bacterium]